MLISRKRGRPPKAEQPKRTPKIYGYPRVSTDEQTQSLTTQADMIEARAKQIPEAKWMGNFPEQASAAKIRYHDRPVFRDLLAKLQAGDILIVWRLDRLERSMFGMVEVLSELNKRDIRLIVLQHGGCELDLNSMTGKILALFLAGMAEMENNQRRESTRNAMQWRKHNGYAYGQAPPGFKLVDALTDGKHRPLKLVVPEDVAILEEIVRRIDNGENVYSIAKSFHARGLTYSKDKRPWAKFRKDNRFEVEVIQRTYKFWRDHPLRVKSAKPGDVPPASSSDASAGDL